MRWDYLAPRVLYWTCWVLYRLRCPSTMLGTYLVLRALGWGFRYELAMWLYDLPTAYAVSEEMLDTLRIFIVCFSVLLSIHFWMYVDEMFLELSALRQGKYRWLPPSRGGRP